MSQITRDVLLVRPRRFGPNPETLSTNVFQVPVLEDEFELAAMALQEFDAMVDGLSATGIRALVCQDTDFPSKPDAVFPNNWVSFHDDASVVLYPMAAANRRPERRIEVIRQVQESGCFRVDRLLDLSHLEARGIFLEGTGSLVFDRKGGVAYAGLSSRTHPLAVAEFSRQTGIQVVTFHTRDEQGQPIYHTNVMLSIGCHFAVLCADAICDQADRARVIKMLDESGRRVIEISFTQFRQFAGNVLELAAEGQRSVVVMSTRAAAAFSPEQSAVMQECSDLLMVPLDSIERVGGGSARCMLAEIFLPRAGARGRIGNVGSAK